MKISLTHLGKALLISLLSSLALTACSQLPSKANTQTKPEPITAPSKATITPLQTPKVVARNFPDSSLYPLLKAELASQRGQYPQALHIYLQQAKQLQNASLARQASLLAKYVKDYPKALDGALLWLKLEPNQQAAIDNAAYIHSRLGQFEPALALLEQAQRQFGSTNYAALAARSLAFSPEQQRYVLQRLSSILQTSPEVKQQQDIRLAQALLLKQFKQSQSALDLLKQNLDLKFTAANNNQEVYVRSLVLASEIQVQQQKQITALKQLQGFTQQHPTVMEARWHYARLLTSVDAKAGRAEFAELRVLAPQDQQVNFSYARLLFLQQDFAQAAIEFKPLLFSPRFRHQALYHLGLISAHHAQYEQALQYLASITPSKEYYPAIKARVGILLQQKNTQAALELLELARLQESKNAVRYYLLEQDVLNEQRQWQRSHELLSQALEQFPDNNQLLYARAMVNERLDRIDILEQDLRQILARDPEHNMALNALGYTLADKTQRYQEALSLISRAYQAQPSDAAVLDSMGWVHYRLGNFEQARHFVERALKQMPDPEIIAHYCEILWFSQQQQQAKELLQQALNKSPNHSILLQTQKRLGITFASSPTIEPNTAQTQPTPLH